MINRNRIVPSAWVTLLLLLSSSTVFAQGRSGDNHGQSFAIGQPSTIQDLPPGQLRKNLESLPAKARERALKKLQEFSFPAEDIVSLHVSDEGFVHYADMFLPQTANVEAVNSELLATFAVVSEAEVFSLHSKPGASNVVFLDFDGHAFSATAWSSSELVALPFDPSQNDAPNTIANFTDDEMNRIVEIWHRISEDYAAFNIDVTTEEPAVFTPTTGRLLFTHDTDANGRAMPSQGAGGTAQVNVFGQADYASKYSPAFVYYTNLSTSSHGLANYTADAASHEFGHNIGLSHDGVSGGTSYYEGHGTGLVSWAPIMGKLYYNNVTQWSKGEYPNANNTQDDIAIITGDLGVAVDDHGDSASQATAMLVEANGDILVSSPEVDPKNLLPNNKGIIDNRTDVDWFFIDVADVGLLTITATPAWHSFARTDKRGANLDIELTLLDASLNIVDINDPIDNTNATVLASVSAGRYYVQIDGVGNNTNSDYSDYGSTGMFFLEGTVEAGSVDSTPPTPGSMSWQTTPHAISETSISMTAVQAEDVSGGIEYFFTCVAGDTGCKDSGWQSSRSFVAGGLTADTFYSYRVSARDMYKNQNSASSSVGDTTNAPPENLAPVAVAQYTPEPAVITKGKTVTVTLNGTGSSDPDGTISGYSWQDSGGNGVSTNSTVDVKLREGTHLFTLTVIDNDGATTSINLSVAVTKDGGDGGGGGGKPCNPRKEVCS